MKPYIDISRSSGPSAVRKASIVLCMGSSCFARGNEANLQLIESFLKRNALEAEVELSGALCEGACGGGPNIKVNDKILRGLSGKGLEEALMKELLGN